MGIGVALDDSEFASTLTATANLPSYRLSLERRLGPSTWLALNGRVSYARMQQLVTPNGFGEEPTRDTLELQVLSVAALLGVRQVLIASIVDISLFGAIGAGYASTAGDKPEPGEFVSTIPGASSNMLGFTSGLAVERRLLEGLAVRLSAELLSATTSRREEIDRENGETHAIPMQTIRLGISPALQLLFYF